MPTLIVRWWRELGPFGSMSIILDAASPLATRLSLHLIEVVNFVVDQLARNHQSPHWDQSVFNQRFTMMMRRRRNYWIDIISQCEGILKILRRICGCFAPSWFTRPRASSLLFCLNTLHSTSHCIVDSTIQKNPPWRCDHLRGQRKPQAHPTIVPLSHKLRPCLL